MHLLKNGHPAHVFTDDDRRKAAAITNEIRREKRALFEQLRLNAEMERRLAADEERRRRRREKRRARASVATRTRPAHPKKAVRVEEPPRTEQPAPPPQDPYADLPANERQALERGWGGELG
jgi:hypothetical protein